MCISNNSIYEYTALRETSFSLDKVAFPGMTIKSYEIG